MATEDAQYSLRVRSLRLTIALSVGLILLLFPIGDASAQEIRSGWEVVDSGTESDLMSAEYFEGNLWAFGTDGTIVMSSDDGGTWEIHATLTSEDLTSSDSIDGDSMVVAGKNGTVLLMKSGSWSDLTAEIGDIADIALTGPDSLVAIAGNTIWTYGPSWESVWVNEGRLNSISFLDSENGLVSGEGGTILATEDGGKTWDYRDAPSEVSSSSIVDIDYYSSIRAYAISSDGHILKSSREGSVSVGFVWNIVEIEREYPPGGGEEFEPGGDRLDKSVTSIEILGQFKMVLSGPSGYLALSLDGGNIVSQQLIPVSNETVFNGFAMQDGFRGVAVGDEGVILRTESAGSEEFVGFEVIDFNDFGQFVDFSKDRLIDGLKATAKIVIFGIIMGFSLGIILSMLKTSPTTLKNVVQTNRFQLVNIAILPIWLFLQIPKSISRGSIRNPIDSVVSNVRERAARVAANEPLNVTAVRFLGIILLAIGIFYIIGQLDDIRALNLDGWEHIYSPIGAPKSVALIVLGIGFCAVGGIFISCNGDFSERFLDFGSTKIKVDPWRIRPLNSLATVYTDLFRNTPLLVQFMFIHFGFELGRRLQDPGLLLFSFENLEGNANFLTNIFVIYETDPSSLAYGRPIGGVLEDRAYISAIFALGLNSGAYQCETIRGAIAAIPSGQMEAGRSIGLNYMQSMRLVIMPQAVRICIPPLGNEMVNLVLNSSLAMIIGYAEITRQGKLIIATTFQVFWTWGMVLVSYFVITWTLALILRYLEEKTKIPGLGISGGT